MDSADDLTFRIIFSGDGAGRLRDRVEEKLKEFMGDYTDDTLVEYVIVLLKNGRRKEEARNELNVFLGADSDSFVSWLWDHLRSNIDLYAQQKEARSDEVLKQKPLSESEAIKSDKLTNKSRRTKDWKTVIRDPDEPPPLRSAVIANIHSDHMKRSPSPQPIIQRKRGRTREEKSQTDERSQVTTETVSKPTLSASRRLLQFAVRDAVAPSRSTSLTSEPSFKRLRSVVSTPNENPPIEKQHYPKIRSVARVPKSMAVAIKAVAEAAKDVKKVKPSGNVFDRLGRSEEISNPIDSFIENDEQQYVEDVSMLENDVGIASEFGYNEGYDGVDRRVAKMESSQIGKPGGHFGNLASSADKMINSSLNVNTWKPRGVSVIENQKVVQENELKAGNYSSPVTVTNRNGVPTVHVQKEIQKTPPSTGVNSTARPTEDVNSRTIFVSNVHFGATKDSLSRHFNKFGDVLKVVIVTEATTGQPKGSAYVEFLKKEAAENALSLDGTSFMSRILKVVRKSCGNEQEGGSAVTTWVPLPRASHARFSRSPFPRGNIYRSRFPIKTGARSLQWKRDSPSDIIPSPTATRSLTYVRPEATKTDANSKLC